MEGNSEKIHEREIRGDTIGETAYSQRFVIGVLMKLLKLNEFEGLEEFIEGDLCTLWDMSVESDVSLFLIHQNALEMFCDTLNNHENTRLAEIIIGIIANICCHQVIPETISNKEFVKKCICNYIVCEDSLVIVQVLRYLDSNILFSNNLSAWLNLFRDIDILSSITFIFNNSINIKVLMNTLKLFSTLCTSLIKDSEKAIFKDIFIKERFSKSLIVGYLEMLNQTPDSVDIDVANIALLSIISSIVNLEETPSIFDVVKTDCISIANNIMVQGYQNNHPNLVEMIQHITASLVVLNSCEIHQVTNLSCTMFLIWNRAVTNIHSQQSKFNDFQADYMELLNILPQYFVRTFVVLSEEQLNFIRSKSDKHSLQVLKTIISDMIKRGEIDEYFSNALTVLNKI